MDELVKLVNEWAVFAKKNPQATVSSFCKYFLARSEKAADSKGVPRPPDLDGHFMKVIMRLSLSYHIYAKVALRDTPLPLYDSFSVLAASHAMGESRKSDVISYSMIDISTGSDIINRLVKEGYLKERVAQDDKRSKLISVTVSGEKVLKACFRKTLVARKLFLKGLSEEEKKLCIMILEPVEARHSALSVQSRNKTIEELDQEAP